MDENGKQKLGDQHQLKRHKERMRSSGDYRRPHGILTGKNNTTRGSCQTSAYINPRVSRAADCYNSVSRGAQDVGVTTSILNRWPGGRSKGH